MDDEKDFVILGAGVTGLAAASLLGDRALLLERDDRPGGLVRTDCLDGFWFDRVLHLLHLPDQGSATESGGGPGTGRGTGPAARPDAGVEARVRRLLGDTLAPCAPEAWVETAAGVTRFPFQMHLAPLDREQVVRCLADLAEVTHHPRPGRAADFEDYLLRAFGRGLCELFMFPYNRKLWKRPLAALAPGGFTWNIARPELEAVLRGALDRDAPYRAYNANGWYPRPPAGAPWRGMEVLSRALAEQAADLRCGHEVVDIDLDAHSVTARRVDDGRLMRVRYRDGCLSTLPLPLVIRMCRQAPDDLRRACAGLTRNRVITVMFGIQGPRPTGTGKWRYYADETLVFNRLVFLHEFDPELAPPDGWGLLAEITEPAEWPMGDRTTIARRALQDVERAGALPPGSRIVVTHVEAIDPAYVVFSVENQTIVEAARQFLASHGVSPVGRYGRWEYSSIAQNMRDGFDWAAGRAAGATEDLMATAPATAAAERV
jgi:protoporphyrinogen oxidase